MGCVSTTLLNHDDDFSQIGGSSALGHHIVSLTSTTYGLLNLDSLSSSSDRHHSTTTTTTLPPTPPRFTLGSVFSTPLSEPRSDPPPPPQPPAEVINSWELMAGLDTTSADSFRFSLPPSNSKLSLLNSKEISNLNLHISNPPNAVLSKPSSLLDGFENLCPPNGDDRVVIYTTTLRGVRKTFEACNSVRSSMERLGVSICERDISMDRGFREELRELMKGKESGELVPPRVFVKGRYVGGAEEVIRMVEEGCFGELVDGCPRLSKAGVVCDGCGGVRFLPCFRCNGSCKMVMVVKEQEIIAQKQGRGTSTTTVVVRCPDCNENGLVLCPICS